MKITRYCGYSEKDETFEVNLSEEEYQHWLSIKDQKNRPNIQDVFPFLSPDEREFLISGMTPEIWDQFCAVMDAHDEEEEVKLEQQRKREIEEDLYDEYKNVEEEYWREF